MSENLDFKQASENKNFIKEKVVKDKKIKKIFKRIVKLILSAVLFGLIAISTAIFSKPYIESFVEPEKETVIETVVIPKDNPDSIDSTEESRQEIETEPVEEIVQSAIEKYRYSINDLNAMFINLSNISNQVDNTIVSVHSLKNNIDLFDNPLQTTGIYSGIIVAKTEAEIIILCPKEAAGTADTIVVGLNDGSEVVATLKGIDDPSNIAVISVSKSNIDELTYKNIEPIQLGNSYLSKRGDMIIAVGSPAGLVHSVDYGFISYIAKNISLVDGAGRLIYTDCISQPNKGVWLINTRGELIGWMTDEYRDNEDKVSSIALGISDFKTILERMMNGQLYAYMGLRVSDLSQSMRDNGMPQGVYVQNLVSDMPAYNAGIQQGDIITRISEFEIKSLSDYKTALEKLSSGASVKAELMRYARDQYEPLIFEVVLGAR